MSEWTRLTQEPYFTEDSHIVTVLGNSAEMQSSGFTLRNALMVPQFCEIYSRLATEGRVQVAQVNSPNGDPLAVARLHIIADNKVGIRFVRGLDNVEYYPGSPAYDAIASYVGAVNDRTIDVSPSIAEALFFKPLPVENTQVAVVPMTPYQKALSATNAYNENIEDVSQHITVVQALTMGMGRVVDPIEIVEFVEPNITWDIPVFSKSYGDIEIVPIDNLLGFRFIGEELENKYFMPHNQSEGAYRSSTSTYLACSVIQNHTVQALAEYNIQNGTMVLRSLTGYTGAKITNGPLADASVSFGRDLNLGVEGQKLFPNGNVLSEADAPVELTDVVINPPQLMGLYRNLDSFCDDHGITQDRNLIGLYNFDEDESDLDEDELDLDEDELDLDEDELDLDEDELDLDARESVIDLHWNPLFGSVGYKSEVGVDIVFASGGEDLFYIGREMENDLLHENTARHYSNYAMNGEMQHYYAYNQDNPTKIIGCGSVVVVNGQLSFLSIKDGMPVKPFGKGYSDAPLIVNIALSEMVTNVNRRNLDQELLVNITQNGFSGVTNENYNRLAR